MALYNAAVRLICHYYVLAELVGLAIARRVPRPETLQFIDTLVRSGEIELIWRDRDLHERAMRLLSERIDKPWSLCDAISFLVMEDNGFSESLTTDHNFEQAGFVRLWIVNTRDPSKWRCSKTVQNMQKVSYEVFVGSSNAFAGYHSNLRQLIPKHS